MYWILVVLLMVTLGGCALSSVKDKISNIIYSAPAVEIKPLPNPQNCPNSSTYLSKKIIGDRVITYDPDGTIISVESIKQ